MRLTVESATIPLVLLGGQVLGHYRVIKPLGAGGFGAVFLAEDTRLGKEVALKVPHKQGKEGEEMLKEPRLMAGLNHPNIIQLFAVDRSNDTFFMVMEYIAGGSLHDYITDKMTIPEDQAIDFAIQILRALDYAHDRHILHRDVRPSNVLVGADGHIKLTDFGTSRHLNTQSQAATRVGSPPYMAPEHFEAKAVFASDLYSVGVILYEMVTGQLPVFDINPVKIYEKVMAGKITPVHMKNHEISREYGAIVEKCMATLLTDRYQLAREVIRDLEALSANRSLPPAQRAVQETRARIEASPYHQTAIRRTPPEMPKIAGPDRKSPSGFCWKCRKPVPIRAPKCPSCGERQ